MHHTETTHINTTFVFFFFNRREFTSKQQEEDWAKRLLATKENQRQLCKILYHLLLLSFWCFTFSNLFWLPHHYFFPAAVLVLSHFLSAWSAPKPAWPPLLVFHHPEIISLQMIKKVTVPGFLYLWLWSQPCRRRFCLRQTPRRKHRRESSQGPTSFHSESFGVPPRWFEKTNKNQYQINTFHLPAMRKSIIQPLHQLLAPDP